MRQEARRGAWRNRLQRVLLKEHSQPGSCRQSVWTGIAFGDVVDVEAHVEAALARIHGLLATSRRPLQCRRGKTSAKSVGHGHGALVVKRIKELRSGAPGGSTK